ncbi:hypothetical protein HC931_10205 [Candidatus Gracilibacteria bacterium]|nr:hypothetical protein [Candidatus Gracilibacteria bacterium]NJP20514.1 hypothetical protein [Hydrococcus sp. CRU_1_1]
MKLERLLQSLVLTGAIVVAIASGAALRAIATSAKSEEVQKDIRGEDFTQLSEIKFRISRDYAPRNAFGDRILGQTLDNPPPTPLQG